MIGEPIEAAKGGERLEDRLQAVSVDRLDGQLQLNRPAGELGHGVHLGSIENGYEAEISIRLLHLVCARSLPFGQLLLGGRAGCPNPYPPLPLADRVADREPAAKTRDASRLRALAGDQQLIVEGVGVEVATHLEPPLPTFAGAERLDRRLHLLALGGSLLGALLITQPAAPLFTAMADCFGSCPPRWTDGRRANARQGRARIGRPRQSNRLPSSPAGPGSRCAEFALQKLGRVATKLVFDAMPAAALGNRKTALIALARIGHRLQDGRGGHFDTPPASKF